MRRGYTGSPAPPERCIFLPLCVFLETDLPAKRASAEAPPRLSREDVEPGGPRDPQAAPRPGPEAPVGIVRRRCSADTGSAARAISMPSTATGGRCRLVS